MRTAGDLSQERDRWIKLRPKSREEIGIAKHSLWHRSYLLLSATFQHECRWLSIAPPLHSIQRPREFRLCSGSAQRLPPAQHIVNLHWTLVHPTISTSRWFFLSRHNYISDLHLQRKARLRHRSPVYWEINWSMPANSADKVPSPLVLNILPKPSPSQ